MEIRFQCPECKGNALVQMSDEDAAGVKERIQMKSMIRGASVGLLFFDVTRLQTLDNLEGYWIPAIEENSTLKLQEGDGPRFMIVANKVDLLDEERYDFIADEMRYVKDKYNMGGQMISARTGIGLDRLHEGFLAIVDRFTAE